MRRVCMVALLCACSTTFELEVSPAATPTDGGVTPVGDPFSCGELPRAPSPARVVLVGDGTRQSCTEAAVRRATSQGGGVRFDCGAGVTEIRLSAPLRLRAQTFLDGDGRVRFSGGGESQLVQVDGDEVVLRRLALTLGRSDRGGAVDVINGGRLWLDQVVFTSNEADGETAAGSRPLAGGGAVHVGADSELVALASNFLNNTSSFGGALWSEGRSALHVVRFRQNQASEPGLARGGGIALTGGELVICDGEFRDNRAGTGGALFADEASVRIERSLVSGNTASGTDPRFGGTGGGAALARTTLLLARSQFELNTALRGGGGMELSEGSSQIENSTFARNAISTGTGAGVLAAEGAHRIAHATFIGSAGAPLIAGAGVELFNSVLSATEPCERINGGAAVVQTGTQPCVDGAVLAEDLALSAGESCGDATPFVPGPGSPAFGAGEGTYCTEVDQCGAPREEGACTAGAVE